ncbi:MAG TPA: membrane protein insertase YidC [Gammaproteobacteria bacterium]|jgi:YidC/Oxa1 family membrane protein insertase|nr:membrane protein insertase YidC [Chromatiales bacterium]MCP4924416.1 membrane protein insertase YidC [Gammaproteobacteria bacterium]MDP7153738.1 membrane protein insertase YidC [Gammaproteobacteria bacterium]MDP7295860.1 membrane protein insertase YidC [Gammaproteobacteria bacterium]HJP38177.1 membrane protein insertase YidC [Gammaproteobacteria bacterium]
MDNIRLFLWMGLGVLIWLSYQTWQKDYAPTPTALDSAGLSSPGLQDAEPMIDDLPSLPELSASELSPGTTLSTTNNTRTGVGQISAANVIHVQTDVLDIKINLDGGDLQFAKLPAYPVTKGDPNNSVQLLSGDPANLFVLGSGLYSQEGVPAPNHRSKFTATQDEYVLADGQNQLVVTLHWQGENGLSAEKIYRFYRGSYAIGLDQVFYNAGTEPYRAGSYLQIKRKYRPPERSMFDVDSYSFVGPVIYDGEKYKKLDAEDLGEEPFDQAITHGWIASIQHHFLVAAVPPAEAARKYTSTFDGNFTLTRVMDSAATSIPVGDQAVFESTLFVGPKLQAQLAEVADGLKLTVDYGRLTVLAQPLFWLLQKIFDIVGNWGWTIVIVTLLIKLVFYKLTEKSGRSMAKMRKIAPRLKAVQERHKDDREALSRAMMELYKREKVNPAAGCWPMLIQIPFFIAFYWVLLESVEMRQAPFMLWITDLSTRDPFFILPLLMGGAMFYQQKLNPPPPDPMQAKIMQFLPLIFTGMFAFFPAGLVLYWLTNSVLSMAQQWRINKVLGAD